MTEHWVKRAIASLEKRVQSLEERQLRIEARIRARLKEEANRRKIDSP